MILNFEILKQKFKKLIRPSSIKFNLKTLFEIIKI